jgi:hypothetical protein
MNKYKIGDQFLLTRYTPHSEGVIVGYGDKGYYLMEWSCLPYGQEGNTNKNYWSESGLTNKCERIGGTDTNHLPEELFTL